MLGAVELFSLQLVDGQIFADLCDFVDLDVGAATYDEYVSLYELYWENFLVGGDFVDEMGFLWHVLWVGLVHLELVLGP